MQQSDEKQKLLELIINPDVVSFKAFFSTSKIHNLALNGSVDTWTALVDRGICSLATNPRITQELEGGGVYV